MVLKPLQNNGIYQQAPLRWFTSSSLLLKPSGTGLKEEQSCSAVPGPGCWVLNGRYGTLVLVVLELLGGSSAGDSGQGATPQSHPNPCHQAVAAQPRPRTMALCWWHPRALVAQGRSWWPSFRGMEAKRPLGTCGRILSPRCVNRAGRRLAAALQWQRLGWEKWRLEKGKWEAQECYKRCFPRLSKLSWVQIPKAVLSACFARPRACRFTQDLAYGI